MLTYILFVVGLAILIKGADILVDGASAIAKRFNVSDLVIGLTIVSVGTSAPELFVNVIAAAKGNTDIAIGNVIGSNIANVFLILGITAIICPIAVTKATVWKEVPYSLLAALVLTILANDRLIDHKDVSELTRIDSIILLVFFIIFMYYLFEISKKHDTIHGEAKEMGVGKAVLFIILGLVGLSLGSEWIVNGAIKFATLLGMDQRSIALTIVAFGTSLPELAAAVSAGMKKQVDLAVGNVIGSNIFNVFLILGISSFIHPLPLCSTTEISALIQINIDLIVMIAANLFVFIFMFTGGKQIVDRWEGVILLVVYIGYMVYLFIR